LILSTRFTGDPSGPGAVLVLDVVISRFEISGL
jgi:hypothetical protein